MKLISEYQLFRYLKQQLAVIIHRKDIERDCIILDLPQLCDEDLKDAERLYKYYWFAENLQYYRSLRLYNIGKPWSDSRRQVLWGGHFATLALDFSYEQYFQTIIKSPERALIRKAIKNGYTVREINYDDHLKEIQLINVSKESRGGRPMEKDYVNVRKRDSIVKPYNPDIYSFGCFSGSGELVAYYMFEYFTNFYHTIKGIGHSDHLNMGVMNYLFAYSVSELSRIRHGKILVYGMMGNDGLSRFKKNVGCQPNWIVYSGRVQDFRNLDAFMENYSLHDDSALNYVHEYIMSK